MQETGKLLSRWVSARSGWLLALGMCLCATVVYRLYRDISSEVMFQQNHELRMALDNSNARVELLEKRIATLHERDAALRSYAKLEAIPTDAREMGVGGSVPSPCPKRRGCLLAASGGFTLSAAYWQGSPGERQA